MVRSLSAWLAADAATAVAEIASACGFADPDRFKNVRIQAPGEHPAPQREIDRLSEAELLALDIILFHYSATHE
jgi:transcriptional regulator GlxA family with amidase domain